MDYKNYFDIPSDITYLNTPGNGLMPRSHHQWRRQRDKEFFDVRGDLREQQGAFIANMKVELSSLFHSKLENTFALPNFSFGLQTLLNGLPNNLNYAILEDDYPSLNFPVISRQLKLVKIKVNEHLEENILNCIKQSQIDVLLLSIVQYINGIKIDLEFIKRLKADYPNLIILADATQYLGTEPFDFSTSGFDAVGGSGYKWLMAGFGNGYLMLSDNLKAQLYAKAQQGVKPKEPMWSNKSILDTYFEPGHQDTLSHGTLLQSIQFFKEFGLEAVQKYLACLQDYAYDCLIERNLLLSEVKNRDIKSSLINVQIDPQNYSALMENGIKCFPRGTGIRIGLHVYNTRQDVDRLMEVIKKVK